jgi:hypothetical protein
MEAVSKQILEGLPTYSAEDLKVVMGRLTLNMYGEKVSEEVATAVIRERKRREALTLAEQINQNRFSGEAITSEQTVRLCELLATLLEA